MFDMSLIELTNTPMPRHIANGSEYKAERISMYSLPLRLQEKS